MANRRRTSGGTAHGLVLVDKPQGPSSFAVVARVRRLYDERQVGHAGTLDPLATGLLPVLVGEATKLTPYLMGLDKSYAAVARLGSATDTYDAEGRVTKSAAPEAVAAVDEARVRAALARFVGRIQQTPPLFSAIKRDGKRLYEIARAERARADRAAAGPDESEAAPLDADGRELVDAEPDEALVVAAREVVVHEITVEKFVAPDVHFTVRCGKGTYIRSIVHDLGEALGCHAHMTALRRTRIGELRIEEAVDVFPEDVVAPPLLPLERAVDHLPWLEVSAEAERRLRFGQQAPLQDLPIPPAARGPVRLVDEGGRLVAIAEASLGRLALSRVFPPR